MGRRVSAHTRAACVLLAATLTVCTHEDDGAIDVADDGQHDTEVLFPDVPIVVFPDTANDTQTPPDATAGCPGGFGCPCEGHDDCLDELCIEGPDGNVCTRGCASVCPNGYECLLVSSFGPDPVSVCVPRHTRLCRPCTQQSDCQNPFDPLPAYCLAATDPAAGRFCGSSCASTACPAGYTCETVPVAGGATARQCVPADGGVCECRPAWADLGFSTDCLVVNDAGACPGSRSCGPDGLTACAGDTAVAETCNALDDDCDGATDELDPRACATTNAFGSCAGVYVCAGDTEVCDAPAPATEACNALDDDCDGVTDEAGCDDALPCTTDTCDGSTCSHALAPGWCRVDGACVLDGAANPADPCQVCSVVDDPEGWSLPKSSCDIDGACVAEGVTKPGDPCMVCDPDADPVDWTALASGDACDDGDACTFDTTCDDDGACLGTLTPDRCDDGLACTVDACNGDGTCTSTPVAGRCAIDGACHAAADALPGQPCRVCAPDVDPLGWSNAVAALPCDDASVCTMNDRCDAAGACVGDETACDDALACTADSCHPTDGCQHTPVDACVIDGACVPADTARAANEPCVACLPGVADGAWSVRPNTCFVDGACVAANTVNPAQACERCVPSVPASQTTWTPVSVGSCSVPSQCLAGGQCVSGVCVDAAPACDDGLSCTTDTCNGDGTCAHGVVAGRCVIEGACWQSGQANPENPCEICAPGTSHSAWSPNPARCSIAGACYVDGAPSPTNPCEVCNAAATRTAWSDAVAGASCNDGDACSADDRCDGGGACVGDTSCDDDLACTTDLCTVGGCVNVVGANACVLDEQCVSAGTKQPGNACRACTPSDSQTVWSDLATGAACNDGSPCSSDDACNGAGACFGNTSCNDGLFCTVDACTPSGCQNTVDQAWCAISGACFQAGVKSAQGCLTCDPARAARAWSNVGTGVACDDGSPCSLGETCDGAGACVGDTSCDDGVICTLDSCGPAGCQRTVAGGFCHIGGQCFNQGFSVANGCASCVPAASATAWTPTAAGVSCANGDVCTEAAACNGAGACVGDNTCNDGDACTLDECTPTGCANDRVVPGKCIIDGVCYEAGPKADNPCLSCRPEVAQRAWTPLGTSTACSDGSACSTDDHCNGAGSCVGDTSCDDGVACTDDVCGAGGCSHPVSAGACLIDGACYAAGPKGDNPCLVCDPARNARAWSNAASGAACSDGSACSTDDACNGQGVCVGNTGCDDGKACTVDQCTAAGCSWATVTNGWCHIGGECFQSGGANADYVCERCTPATSKTAWSPAPVSQSCNDGSACSSGDHCDGAGACVGDTSCSDGISCTIDVCNHATGCSHTQIAAGRCLIDGACVSAGPDPSNPCRVCNPEVNARAWTNASSATACNDGSACSTDDHCNGQGQCVGNTGCDDGIACTVDVCTGGGCSHSGITAGWCRIGGTCYQNGAKQAGNACQRCDASANPSGWTNEPTTVSCNDLSGCSTDDHCDGAGTCIGDRSCSDGVACTDDVCVTVFGSGFCSNPVSAGKCRINGTCYNDGTLQPGNSCMWCDDASSSSAWVARTGASCNDGDLCSGSDMCNSSGVCTGTPLKDGYEDNNSWNAARAINNFADGDGWDSRRSLTADLYPTGDEDWYRYRVVDNTNIWDPHPRVELSGIPSGRDYDLCVYWVCDDPGDQESIGCENGFATSFNGHPGCCSNASSSASERVDFSTNCANGGFADDETGTAYVRVYRWSGAWTCDDYTLTWGNQ